VPRILWWFKKIWNSVAYNHTCGYKLANGVGFIKLVASYVLIENEGLCNWKLQLVKCLHWINESRRMGISKEWSHMIFMWWCKTFCHYACDTWWQMVVGWRSFTWIMCSKNFVPKLWTWKLHEWYQAWRDSHTSIAREKKISFFFWYHDKFSWRIRFLWSNAYTLNVSCGMLHEDIEKLCEKKNKA
jgi:hypothetical protein